MFLFPSQLLHSSQSTATLLYTLFFSAYYTRWVSNKDEQVRRWRVTSMILRVAEVTRVRSLHHINKLVILNNI